MQKMREKRKFKEQILLNVRTIIDLSTNFFVRILFGFDNAAEIYSV